MAAICPSLLAADFGRLGEVLELIRQAGSRMVHVDVCDGHFAPGVTVGQPVISGLRKATALILDVHLLVERPERFVGDFADAGADRIAVHPESTRNFYRVLRMIRSKGVQCGAALNPETPVESVSDVLQELDFLTILSAQPGEAEEAYIPRATAKLRAALSAREKCQAGFALQVEGGIDWERMTEAIEAGAEILVVGSAVFSHPNPGARLEEFIRYGSERTEKVASIGSSGRE